MKNILFYSPLGRAGKSTLAYHCFDYQKRRKIPYKYCTNDIGNTSFSIKKLIPNDLIILKPNSDVEIDDKDKIIFDFGGYLDSRVVDVAKYVDHVVLLVMYQSNSELKLIVKAVNSLKTYNENITVIINNTETSMIQEAMEILDIALADIDLFTLNRSKYFHRLANYDKSVYDLLDESKLERSQLNRTVIPQLKTIFDKITQ